MDSLTNDERLLIASYRKLSRQAQLQVLRFISGMLEFQEIDLDDELR